MPLWQVAHCARALEDRALPRAAAAASKLPAGGGGAASVSWYACSAGSFDDDQVVGAVGHVHAGARLRERAVAAHLRDGDVAVPVRDVVAVAGGVMRLMPAQAVRGRDHLRAVHAVQVEARVVLALAPGVVDRLRLRRQRGRQRDDRARVEVAVGPAVEPLADAGRERVVDRRVAQRAGDADARQRVRAVDGLDRALQADDRVELEQRDRRRGARRLIVPSWMPCTTAAGSASASTFKPDRQRRRRIDGAAR